MIQHACGCMVSCKGYRVPSLVHLTISNAPGLCLECNHSVSELNGTYDIPYGSCRTLGNGWIQLNYLNSHSNSVVNEYCGFNINCQLSFSFSLYFVPADYPALKLLHMTCGIGSQGGPCARIVGDTADYYPGAGVTIFNFDISATGISTISPSLGINYRGWV